MTMHPHHERRSRASTFDWSRALCLALTLALADCGGGVDSGGTGGTAASFASGPITGFGSVIVNGVHFDDSSSSVTDDTGATRSRDELRLGMSTEIRGSGITLDAAGSSVSTASRITFGSDILGPIERIDATSRQLVVLGQTVETNPTTVFDEVSVSGGLSSLGVGNLVEVHAQFDVVTGHYIATRIERRGAAAVYRLRGLVTQLDTTARAFNIGSERISYAGLSGPAPASLVNGNFVRLRLHTAKVGGVWAVAALTDGVQRPQDLDEVRLEGLISAFGSAAQFSVNGVAVNAANVTPPAGLALGARVEVEGTASGAVLVARKVEVKTQGDVTNEGFELRGAISSVDAPNQTFSLRGETVKYAPGSTEFRNGTAAGLAPAVYVEARGILSVDGTRLLATRITFK
jgi:hypothetical protein